MNDMPDRITIARAENGRGETLETLFIAVNEPDGATYIRSDLVPTWNRDMSTAPVSCDVLIATDDGIVGEARFSSLSREWRWGGRARVYDPIAWMPLPKHPDGGEE